MTTTPTGSLFRAAPEAPPSPPAEITVLRATAQTGPTSQNGKAIVSQNAVSHGLFSDRPVIRGAESQEEWDTFRTTLVASLTPADAAQLALAERAALYFWRLRRVARYEAEVTADDLDRAEFDAVPNSQHGIAGLRNLVAARQETLALYRRVPTLPDDAPLTNDEAWEVVGAAVQAAEDVDEERFTVPGVPGSVHYLSFYKWTARHVRDCLTFLAAQTAHSEHSWPDGKALLTDLTSHAQGEVERAEREVAAAERAASRLRRLRQFPSDKALDKIIRAEAHLNRLLSSTLHELEALQARAKGQSAPLLRVDHSGANGELPEITKQNP